RVDVDHRHGASGGGEAARDRAPDPAATTSDDRRVVFEQAQRLPRRNFSATVTTATAARIRASGRRHLLAASPTSPAFSCTASGVASCTFEATSPAAPLNFSATSAAASASAAAASTA